MKKEFLKAAELIHSCLRTETNCYQNGTIIPANYIVSIDDDATSALWAAHLFYEIRKTHGYCPTVICVGGKGLMSKHTHQKSEAELLSYVLQKLGIHPSRISVLEKGRNTGDNVLEVAQAVSGDAKVIWCVTQRLSLRLERTQAQQAPEVNSSYFVIEETLEKVMKMYNGKGLCGGQMLLHELASILNRCQAYAGTFQKAIDFPIDDNVFEAAHFLEKKFRLKLPKKNLKSYVQFIQLYFAILKNKTQMQNELEKAIISFAEEMKEQGLVGPGDCILNAWIPTEVVGYEPSFWNGCYGWGCETWGGEAIHAEPVSPYGLK